MEAMSDPAVREVIALKCAQGGGTENLLLMPIRWAAACAPVPVLYVGGQQESTEAFLEERIKSAFQTSPGLRDAWARARIRGTEIYFPDMIFAATWARAVQGLKTRPVGMALCDEVSIWPENSLDKVRARASTYPLSHLAAISSPDATTSRPSADDPIFIEYRQTDKRKWFMPDPVTGNLFFFEMGSKKGAGLQWDPEARTEDGWDHDRVRETAFYRTPDGTEIRQDEKEELVRKGRWRATDLSHDVPWKRGYHLPAFVMPWVAFGDIAVRFLDAKARGPEALRVFVGEVLAEPWIEQIERPNDAIIYERQGEYSRASV